MTISEFINKVGFQVKDEDVKKVNDSISGIKNTATKLLGAIGIGFSLASINSLIEEFGSVNNAIQNSVGELENMEEAQSLVLAAANDCRGTYSNMASTVSNLVKSSSELFPVEDAAEYTSVVTKLLKTAGRSESTIASVMEGLNKSFQKGVVDTETLNKLLEQAPEAANVLANHLGVAKTQLLDMAANGQMSVKDLKDAFLNSADEINAAFGNVDMTISDALTHIRNQWGLWLSQTDKTLGVTKTIAKVMVSAFNGVINILTKVRTALTWLAEKVGGTEKLLKLVAIVAGSLLVAFNFDKIKTGFKTITSLLKGFKAQTLAIVAVIVVLALLVEDFINFVNGNDSLIGSFLEKAGVDTDEVREKFKGLGGQFKELMGVVTQLGSTLLQALVSVLGVVLEQLMNLIVAILPVVIDLLNKLIPFIIQIIQAILPVLVDLINQIIPLIIQIIQGILPVVISLISQILPLIMKLIESLLPVVIDLITAIIPLVMQIIQAILPVIIQLINALIPLITQIIEAILPVVIELINVLIPIVMQIIEAILPVLIELINAVIPIITQIIEAILPILIELINAVIPIVTQIIDAILPIILELINALLPPFMQIVNTILPLITQLIQQLLPVIEPIIALVSNLAQAILPVIVSVLNAIIPIIQTIAKVLGPVFDIIGLIVNAVAKVVGWIASGLGWVVDLFFGGGGNTSKAKDVAAYADGSDYTDDTFIAGEEGPELITNQRGRKVFTAAETGRIFDNVAKLANAKTPSPSTAQVVSNNSDIRKSVVQNVEINNEFNGDKAIQKEASQTMDKSAEDITAQLARGIALAI